MSASTAEDGSRVPAVPDESDAAAGPQNARHLGERRLALEPVERLRGGRPRRPLASGSGISSAGRRVRLRFRHDALELVEHLVARLDRDDVEAGRTSPRVSFPVPAPTSSTRAPAPKPSSAAAHSIASSRILGPLLARTARRRSRSCAERSGAIRHGSRDRDPRGRNPRSAACARRTRGGRARS